MEHTYEQDYQEVLKQILVSLKERIPAILAVVLVSAILGWSVSAFLLPTKYEASVNMIVNTRSDTSGSITNDNISSAQNLVDTYAIIIKSNKILNKVITDLNLDLSYKELYEMVSVAPINNTQVMKIAVQGNDRETCRRIVVAISTTAPAIVVEAVEAGSCKVISDVYVEEEPISPNVQENTVIAAGLGLVICLAVLVLKELMNDYIVDDTDVEKKLGIPVLSVIPNVEAKKHG